MTMTRAIVTIPAACVFALLAVVVAICWVAVKVVETWQATSPLSAKPPAKVGP